MGIEQLYKFRNMYNRYHALKFVYLNIERKKLDRHLFL